MKLTMKSVLTALCLVAASSAAAADWTPPGPIKMMIAFRAGGGVLFPFRQGYQALERLLEDLPPELDYLRT